MKDLELDEEFLHLRRRYFDVSPFQFDYIASSDLTTTIKRYASKVYGDVLDYGCGPKPYSEIFTNAKKYVGADFPKNKYADIHLDEQGRLPAQLQHFDSVVSFQVLEHVQDVSVYLEEIKRALNHRKGKNLLLTTHGIWEYHPGPKDLHRWTHEGLKHLLESCGFTTVALEPITTGARSLLQLAALELRGSQFRGTRLKKPTFWLMNHLADCLKENPDLEKRFHSLPLGYLFCGVLGD